MAVKTTIDKAGRLVLPKAIRDELGLAAGQQIELRVEGAHVIMEPAAVRWHIERRGRVSVLVPDGPVPPLTDDDVRAALDEGRDPDARRSQC